ncbi:MAG: mevalonate kinase, partial [Deltaproteobacteria bacterium]|nr:mevalonate kinase [Deltaproteobacteria bacterium]
VVHGGRALAIPLTALGTTVEITTRDESAPHESAPLHLDDGACEPPVPTRDRVLAEQMIARATELLGASVQGRVTSRSTIPIGQGLGSSAAFAVALVGALHRATSQEASVRTLRDHAHALEMLVHGSPSGIDDGVVAEGRPLVYRRSEALQPIDPGTPLHLVFASAGRPAPTREAVDRVHALRARDPARFEDLLANAEDTVTRGVDAFSDGDARTLGERLNAMHGLLSDLDVSTPQLDALVQRARAAGAFGAKLTGAGLGGFMLALVAPSKIEGVHDALCAAGATTCFVSHLFPAKNRPEEPPS